MAQQNQSMNEGLGKLLGQVAQMQLLPDADMEFLNGLQAVITQFLRNAASANAEQAAGMSAGAGNPPMGGPMGGMGGGPAGMGAPPGLAPPGPNQMGPGGMAGGGMGGLTTPPNPDELRRVLANASMGPG